MLWLPAVTNEAVSAIATSESKTAAVSAKRPERILIVDDDAIVRGTLVQQIEAEGYAVLSAASGTEALAMLDRGEAVDLVLADLSMPGMDGERLINEARRRRPLLPAILLTGFAPNAEIAMDSVFIVLGKPIEGKILAQRMAMLLNNTSGGMAAPD